MTGSAPILRVLVAALPRLSEERLLRQLESHAELTVVGRTSRLSDTLVMAGDLLPDVVLLTGEEDESIPGICTHLLYEFPEIAVVAIAPNGQHATVFRQTITSEKFDGILEQGLTRVFDGLRSRPSAEDL